MNNTPTAAMQVSIPAITANDGKSVALGTLGMCKLPAVPAPERSDLEAESINVSTAHTQCFHRSTTCGRGVVL